MSRYRVAVHIVPRRGLLDPQGKAVADALHSLGFNGVRDVRVGRHLVIDADAPEPQSAERRIGVARVAVARQYGTNLGFEEIR